MSRKQAAQSWTDDEFGGLDLGDARLNNRARKLMETFATKPKASIPEACDNWTETQAAYRFMANPEVTWDGILAPHWARTMERMATQKVILCIQDTTELDFSGQNIDGLGPLNYEARRGMYVHPTYAVSPEREPLGLLDGWMWAREERGADGKRPASVKESERWIEGYERVAEQATQLPNTRLVYVADREADMMGMLRRAAELGTPADWLVRAKHDRCLADGESKRLWPETTAGMPLGEISFIMAGRGKQRARQVRQQVWAKRVLLRDGKRGKIEATCIVASEVQPPTGIKPVEWRLLTNRRAETLADASELIDWYRARWEIEIFFNVLKNGCEVEELQLSTMARLERALALFMVVAWRIAYLMRKGRTCPDLDATLFFDPDEIRAAYLLNKKKAPAMPGLNEVLRMVARVGGFLARKHDGEPGVKTIWRGLQDVQVSAQTIRTLREMGALQD
ncbi:IS4 family transposase [Massilia sp. W12]|uniref:IS4 family transposase n=1 Tax=Massilia sp. W12 TaxID=3126507 RepID=UPI0030D22D29